MNQSLLRACFVVALLAVGDAAACTVSATSAAFGTIDPLVNTETLSTATVSVSCPESTSYTVALGPGNGTIENRLMVSGTHELSYNLYTDASRSIIWGDGTGGSSTVSGTADSSGTDHTVYGHVPWQPSAVPGTYSDSIVVTATF